MFHPTKKIEFEDGSVQFYKNCLSHNENVPAIIFEDEQIFEYWINDRQIEPEDFCKMSKQFIQKTLKIL